MQLAYYPFGRKTEALLWNEKEEPAAAARTAKTISLSAKKLLRVSEDQQIFIRCCLKSFKYKRNCTSGSTAMAINKEVSEFLKHKTLADGTRRN